METLLLVPLDDSIVFPGMTVTLALDLGEEERVLLVPRTRRRVRLASAPSPRSSSSMQHSRAAARAVDRPGPASRGIPGAAHTDAAGALRVEVDRRTRTSASVTSASARSSASTGPWSRRSSSCAAPTRAIARVPALDHASRARSPTRPATRPTSAYEDKIELLETLDVTERLEKALELQRERLAELQVRARIRDDVQSGAEQQQREYFLRKQMESIRKELGEDEGSVADEYRRQDRGGRHAGGRPRAGREGARRGSSGWARPPASPR